MPDGLAVGPDGNFWICENSGNRIARETTAGVVTHFSTGITPNWISRPFEGPAHIA